MSPPLDPVVFDLDEGDALIIGQRDHDRPLTFHWKVDEEAIRSVGAPWCRSADYNAARNSILTEAIIAHDAGQWVSYSRTKSFYSGLRRYHGTAFTYTIILAVIDELGARGLIKENRTPPGQRGWQSRFRATPLLIERWRAPAPIYDCPSSLRLKDEGGHLIDFRDTDQTRRMAREMEVVNECLGGIRFDINVPEARRTAYHLELDGGYYVLDPRPFGYRVFNRGSWSMGGRLYGPWQGFPKIRRAAALINGERVAEPDFQAMHPAMLYARLGKRLDFDPYDTGVFPREHCKRAFVVAINAASSVGAINAIATSLAVPKKYASDVYAAIRMKNKDLDHAGAFGSDEGIRLMRLDSEITIGALKAAARKGIPALPIHDSMLTPVRHADEVAGLMEESFERQFKGAISCCVRVSADSVRHMASLPSASLLSPPASASLLSPPASALPLGLVEDESALSSTRPISETTMTDEEQLDLFRLFDVRLIRQSLGLTQEQLADRLGIRRAHLANVERRHDRLGRRARQRLRQAIGTRAAA